MTDQRPINIIEPQRVSPLPFYTNMTANSNYDQSQLGQNVRGSHIIPADDRSIKNSPVGMLPSYNIIPQGGRKRKNRRKTNRMTKRKGRRKRTFRRRH
jgi:hypothetical protein